jgi:hypothetical protein
VLTRAIRLWNSSGFNSKSITFGELLELNKYKLKYETLKERAEIAVQARI